MYTEPHLAGRSRIRRVGFSPTGVQWLLLFASHRHRARAIVRTAAATATALPRRRSPRLSKGSVETTPGHELLFPGRVGQSLGTLRWELILCVLGLLALLPGVPAAPAAVAEPEQQPSVGAALPPSLSILPKACLESGRESQIPPRLLEAIRNHPTAGAWNALGVVYGQHEALDCAIPSFQAALRLQPDLVEARYNLALALIKTGHSQKAMPELQSLIRQKPQFAGPHYALGMVLQSNAQLGAAESEYEAAIHADPHFYASYLSLARLFEAEKRYPKAISSLEQALALKPPQDVADQLQTTLDKARAELSGSRRSDRNCIEAPGKRRQRGGQAQ